MIAVLASGAGSNFEAIALAFPNAVTALVTNVPGAGVLDKARALSVPARVVPHADCASRENHERGVLDALAELMQGRTLRIILLLGYMRILTPAFFAAVRARFPEALVLNLHPAHLDDYKGPRAYEACVVRKAPRWGLTVHVAVPALDSGPVIASIEIAVPPWADAAAVAALAKDAEHALVRVAVTRCLETAAQSHFPQERKQERC